MPYSWWHPRSFCLDPFWKKGSFYFKTQKSAYPRDNFFYVFHISIELEAHIDPYSSCRNDWLPWLTLYLLDWQRINCALRSMPWHLTSRSNISYVGRKLNLYDRSWSRQEDKNADKRVQNFKREAAQSNNLHKAKTWPLAWTSWPCILNCFCRSRGWFWLCGWYWN